VAFGLTRQAYICPRYVKAYTSLNHGGVVQRKHKTKQNKGKITVTFLDHPVQKSTSSILLWKMQALIQPKWESKQKLKKF